MQKLILDYFAAGKFFSAEKIVRDILDENPDDIFSIKALGAILHATERYEEAIFYKRRAIDLLPSDPEAASNLANTLLKFGRFLEAERLFRQVLRLWGEKCIAWDNLGLSLLYQDKYEEALVAFEKALLINQNDDKVLHHLGLCYYKMNRFSEAIDCLAASLDSNSENLLCMNDLAAAYLQLKQTDNAKSLLLKILELDSRSIFALNNMGLACQQVGNFIEAINYFLEVLKFSPKNETANYGLLSMCQDSGQMELAKRYTIEPLENSRYKYRFEVRRLISLFLKGNSVEAQNLVVKLKTITSRNRPSKDDANALPFIGYIEALLGFIKNNSSGFNLISEKLYALGESHSLSPNRRLVKWGERQMLVESCFVMGAKMHHLKPFGANSFKEAVRLQILKLEDHSHLLFIFGEIDCRLDQGIWNYSKKYKMDITLVIKKTVCEYLDFIESQVRGRIFGSLTVQGIPAPMCLDIKIQELDDRSRYLLMIKAVNEFLRDKVKEKRWGFLDVYTATVGTDLCSNGRWHIDRHHLTPEFYDHSESWLLMEDSLIYNSGQT